jgi:xylose isomerase
LKRSYFGEIAPIAFEGAQSSNPLAYRYYDKSRMIAGKSMEEHLRMAVCYWHSFNWDGFDVFGAGTFQRPWHAGALDQAAALHKLDEAFEFFTRLGLPYFCFHDVDVMAQARSIDEHVSNFLFIVEKIEQKMAASGVKLLWGTANLFSHPRYMAGAATNPDPEVFRFAATQVRHCLEATHRLKGENYVLWGGREGYDTLLNTNLKQEKEQLGRFLSLVVEHKHKIGFTGAILIEPKPHEPTKHQYDFDVDTIYGFLKHHGLEKEVKVNIESNHATLSGHSFEHEIAMAVDFGIFGSIDMNRGDMQNGWDTDQFPNDIREITLALYYVLKGGGFSSGGNNFDAKVRRQSIDPVDLFYGHIGAIDILARGLINACAMLKGGEINDFIEQRYAGWHSDPARRMLQGKVSLAAIADAALAEKIAPKPHSGRQEYLENLVSRYTSMPTGS